MTHLNIEEGDRSRSKEPKVGSADWVWENSPETNQCPPILVCHGIVIPGKKKYWKVQNWILKINAIFLVDISILFSWRDGCYISNWKMREVHTQATLPQQYQCWEEKEVRIQATLPVWHQMFQINSMSPGGKGGSEAVAQPKRVGFFYSCVSLTAHWITYNCSYTLQKAGRESCKDLVPWDKERREGVKSCIITENRKRGNSRVLRCSLLTL